MLTPVQYVVVLREMEYVHDGKEKGEDREEMEGGREGGRGRGVKERKA